MLRLSSDQTAWSWLHKRRQAMVVPQLLDGPVVVDETYGGGVDRMRSPAPGNKALVVIAVAVWGRALRRIRLRRTPDASARSLQPFIQDSVVPGASVLTDGGEPYKALPKLGYVHQAKVIRCGRRQASQLLPGVRRVASLLNH